MSGYYRLTVEALHQGAGIPREEAERLCALGLEWLRESGYAGERIYIPAKARDMSPAERAEEVRKLQGRMKISEIAEQFDIDERTVYRYFRRIN